MRELFINVHFSRQNNVPFGRDDDSQWATASFKRRCAQSRNVICSVRWCAGYAYAKRMLDVQTRLYREDHGCNFVSVVPTNIYGPFDNFNLEDSHVIPGLMHKCLLAKKANTDFVIWGSGSPLRQFIYSEDLGALMVWCLYNYNQPEPLILSVGEEDEISIADVARLIVEAMNFKGNLVFDKTKSDGQYKKTASNKKLLSLHPSFRFTPIKSAIQKTATWFEANYHTARK